MKYIAYTVKGLEQIAKKEILEEVKGVEIEDMGNKYIIFEAEIEKLDLNKIRTVGDVGILLLKLGKPKKLKLEELTQKLRDTDLSSSIKDIKKQRNLDTTFSITLSISGLKINKLELQNTFVNFITHEYNLEFTPQSHNNLDIRIFLNRKVGSVSVRLTKEPLYKRDYKQFSSMGSLKPTIAGAMIKSLTGSLTSNHSENLKLVDNFCGSGTFLAEAHILGFNIYGGDIDSTNVINTKRNLSNLNFKQHENIKELDATKTKWPNSFFDFAVSNLPWNKQISVKRITDLYTKTLEEYKRILKPEGSISLLVHKPQILIKYAKKYFPNHKIVSTKISFTGQSPTIVNIIN